MIILLVIILMALSALFGYYLGKGQIVINRVANKKMSEKILKDTKREYEETIEQMQAAIEEYNNMVGGL